MEALGRLINVIPIAASRGISLVGASGITFVTTGSDTFTLTCASTFAGTYASPGTIVANVYKSAATNGTAVWVKDQTLISTNTIVSGGAIAVCFHIPGTSLPDGKTYVKLAPTGGGLITAILHDLKVQRGPANLAIPSA